MTVLLVASFVPPSADGAHLSTPEELEVFVIQVYPADKSANDYSKSRVMQILNKSDSLWRNISYGDMTLDINYTGSRQLPKNSNGYVSSARSTCDRWGNTTQDTQGLLNAGEMDDLVSSDLFLIIMENTGSGFQSSCGGPCTVGSGGDAKRIGCAIGSENPSLTDLNVMGRWGHEAGHALQTDVMHPSGYDSEFELLDSNYPGHMGAWLKFADPGFDGWLPESKVQVVDRSSGGDTVSIWAVEKDPDIRPNIQAVQVKLTDNLYYMLSVRRRVNGDELNADYADGIPDEGVLIERVVIGGDTNYGDNRTVAVQGVGNDTDDLWEEGQTYTNTTDGVTIEVQPEQPDDPDSYQVKISFGDVSDQPDAMLHPWRSPPGNTWETVDIWIDSPVNGYDDPTDGSFDDDKFRYGTWKDNSGRTVPKLNGDPPAAGQTNRLYARIHNNGSSTASNVEATFEITDPLGVGIHGADGWAEVGTVDSGDFPGLASIPPDGYVDVYVDLKPEVDVSEQEVEDGLFDLHSCVRVKLDTVSGETILGNQDGEDEQENIETFDASVGEDETMEDGFTLENEDDRAPRRYTLSYDPDIPKGWDVDVNNGDLDLLLAPGETRFVPVKIDSKAGPSAGSRYTLDIEAFSVGTHVKSGDPSDRHEWMASQGGVSFGVQVVVPTSLKCEAVSDGNTMEVTGELTASNPQYDTGDRLVRVVAVDPSAERLDETTSGSARTASDGSFTTAMDVSGGGGQPSHIACMFLGTEFLGASGSRYVEVQSSGADLDQPADIQVKLTSSSSTVTVGEDVQYEASVFNAGPNLAKGTSLAFSLPSQVEFENVSTTTGSCSHDVETTCSLGDLDVEAEATVTVTAGAVSAGELQVDVEVRSDTPDPDASNNDAIVVQTVEGSDLSTPAPGVSVLVASVGVALVLARRRGGR